MHKFLKKSRGILVDMKWVEAIPIIYGEGKERIASALDS
jgi:hypothetical protein